MANDYVGWGLMLGLDDEMNEFLKDAKSIVNGLGTGLPPRDLAAFSSQSTEDGIKLTFTPPAQTYIDDGGTDQFAVMPAGVLIRYSDTGYPRTPDEGKFGYDYKPTGDWVTTSQECTIVGLTKDTKYYFTAFPYSTEHVYNKNQVTANRTEMTWVGNKGTISVTVQTPEGYEGTLGEYTITLVDQATESPQNIEKTFSGTGVKMIGNLTGGKIYKVRLGTPDVDDLMAPADSEAITIVAGTNHELTVAYVYKYGNIQVNVASVPAGMRFGSYTVTLTPQSGGQALTATGSGGQSLTFNNLVHGETYTVGLTALSHYTANPNGSVTAVGNQTTQHNASYQFNASFAEATWQEISDVIQCAEDFTDYFALGESRNLTVKKYSGSLTGNGYFQGTKTSKSVNFKIIKRNGVGVYDKATGSLQLNNNTMILWPSETLLSINVQTDTSGSSIGFGDTGIAIFLSEHKDEMIPDEIKPYVPKADGNSPQYCSVGQYNNDGNGYWEFSYGRSEYACGLVIPSAKQLGASSTLIPRGTTSRPWTSYLYTNDRRKLDSEYGTTEVVNADYQSTDTLATQADPRWVMVDATGEISNNESDHKKITGSPLINYPVAIVIN